MTISKVRVIDEAKNYWNGADKKPWRGVGLQKELSLLGLALGPLSLKSHGDLERYLFDAVTEEVKNSGAMSPVSALLVSSWKTDRSLPCVAMNERVSGTVHLVTMEAFQVGLTASGRLAHLRSLHGVNVPLASAFLTVAFPLEFTVIDVRALKALRKEGELDHLGKFRDRSDAWWNKNYKTYLEVCEQIAAREDVALRDLDRCLWKLGG